MSQSPPEVIIEPDPVELITSPTLVELTIAPVLTEVIITPVGDQGPPGPPGPAGADGTDGQDGVGGITEAEMIVAVETAVLNHELDPTPHSAYDDLPSFAILFENGLL